MSNMDFLFDKMVEEQAKVMAEEEMAKKKETNDSKEEAKNLLKNLSEYLKSKKLDDKCKEMADKQGVGNYKIVKNVVIRNILGKIGNILGLTVKITSDLIRSAVNFISNVISIIVTFTENVLHKLIDFLTLNCGNKIAA